MSDERMSDRDTPEIDGPANEQHAAEDGGRDARWRETAVPSGRRRRRRRHHRPWWKKMLGIGGASGSGGSSRGRSSRSGEQRADGATPGSLTTTTDKESRIESPRRKHRRRVKVKREITPEEQTREEARRAAIDAATASDAAAEQEFQRRSAEEGERIQSDRREGKSRERRRSRVKVEGISPIVAQAIADHSDRPVSIVQGRLVEGDSASSGSGQRGGRHSGSGRERRPVRRGATMRVLRLQLQRTRASIAESITGDFTVFAIAFFIVALLQRFATRNLNGAEYTDGILMIGRDVFGATFWPPLYTWACWGLGLFTGGDFEVAGRLVSVLAGAAAVVPIMWIAGEFGGSLTDSEKREAWAFAGLFYLASPIAWRWGIRVMSDSLFLFLWWAALAFLARSFIGWRAGRGLGGAFVLANIFGVLSALTRHQGVFMLPFVVALAAWSIYKPRRHFRRKQRVRVSPRDGTALLATAAGDDEQTASDADSALVDDATDAETLAADLDAAAASSELTTSNEPKTSRRVYAHRRRARWRTVSWGAIATLAVWIAYPLAQGDQVAAHVGQVTYRASLGTAEGATESAATDQPTASSGTSFAAVTSALLALTNMTESFLYMAPYFFTPGIFLFAIIGAIRRPGLKDGGLAFAVVSFLLVGMILGAQGLFQSFLSRYLLPLLPIVIFYAARGALWAQSAWKRPIFLTVLLVALAWGIVFSIASLVLQREAFADVKRAGEMLRVLSGDVEIFANETYKAESGMHAIKLEWWSGRRVRPLRELIAPGAPRPASGTIIVLSSVYGGPEAFVATQQEMGARFGAGPLGPAFDASIVPLLPDIMMGPQQGHQSPLAWVYRYQRQQFRTVILRVP